jgi:hypothetical protein
MFNNAILRIYPLRCSRTSSISQDFKFKLERTPERRGNDTNSVAVTTSDKTHFTFVPKSTPYYWPDTPIKPRRDQSYRQPLTRQHARLFLRQPGPSPVGLKGMPNHLLIPSLTDPGTFAAFESGPAPLVPQFSTIQNIDGMCYAPSLSGT